MRAPKLGDLRGLPLIELITAGKSLQNPRIDGESFQFACAEKQNAVSDFLADAGKFDAAA